MYSQKYTLSFQIVSRQRVRSKWSQQQTQQQDQNKVMFQCLLLLLKLLRRSWECSPTTARLPPPPAVGLSRLSWLHTSTWSTTRPQTHASSFGNKINPSSLSSIRLPHRCSPSLLPVHPLKGYSVMEAFLWGLTVQGWVVRCCQIWCF